MKRLIPLVFMLIGIGGGVGAGLALRPAAGVPGEASGVSPEGEFGDDREAVSQGTAKKDNDRGRPDKYSGAYEYIKLSNQFVVPLVADDGVEAMIVMSLSLEVKPGQSEMVFSREPKLRDVFLQVMFDHANMGGFRGTFTDTGRLEALRRGFLDVAQAVLGPIVTEVLITDIIRQKI